MKMTFFPPPFVCHASHPEHQQSPPATPIGQANIQCSFICPLIQVADASNDHLNQKLIYIILLYREQSRKNVHL